MEAEAQRAALRQHPARLPWTSVPEAHAHSSYRGAMRERKFVGSRSRTTCSSKIAHSEQSQLRLPCDNVDTTSLCNPLNACCGSTRADLGYRGLPQRVGCSRNRRISARATFTEQRISLSGQFRFTVGGWQPQLGRLPARLAGATSSRSRSLQCHCLGGLAKWA